MFFLFFLDYPHDYFFCFIKVVQAVNIRRMFVYIIFTRLKYNRTKKMVVKEKRLIESIFEKFFRIGCYGRVREFVRFVF